jgi:hypothetical protein
VLAAELEACQPFRSQYRPHPPFAGG